MPTVNGNGEADNSKAFAPLFKSQIADQSQQSFMDMQTFRELHPKNQEIDFNCYIMQEQSNEENDDEKRVDKLVDKPLIHPNDVWKDLQGPFASLRS